jgi:hypothetical protein
VVGDPNFPLPDPSFLLIHEVWLRHVVSTTTDSRGRPRIEYSPQDLVPGYLTAPNPNNEDSAGTERVRFDAVLLLSRGEYVTESTLVRCVDKRLPPLLGGIYKVEVVRPNISHTRCLLVRYTGPWELEES